MISELNDNEILNFLMTSEFEDDYSPSELKYLLLKWKYFYRLLHGISERDSVKLKSEINEYKDKLELIEKNIDNLRNELSEKEATINSMKNRNLTWKERFTGKIITTENEN